MFGSRAPGHRAHAAFARYGFVLGEGRDPRVRGWLATARRRPLQQRLATVEGIELELAAYFGWPFVARLRNALGDTLRAVAAWTINPVPLGPTMRSR